jgi:hypothetical protein
VRCKLFGKIKNETTKGTQVKNKPKKQQDDRLLKQLPYSERKRQEQIRKLILTESAFLAV